MKPERDITSALERTLRRPLPPPEAEAVRRALADRPDEREAWEQDQQLSSLLSRLSPAEVPSDFTRRVLSALDREPAAPFWRRWFEVPDFGRPGWASGLIGSAVLVIGLALAGTWYRHATPESTAANAAMIRITRPVLEAGQAVQLPPVDILQDYDAIDQMRRLSALADEELLASLELTRP